MTSYAFKNFFVGDEGLLSVYLAFNSPHIKIDKDIGKFVGYAKSILFNSTNIIAGTYYSPTVANSLSFGLESNGRDFVSLSVYTAF